MESGNGVSIKGTGEGVMLHVPSETPLEEIFSDLKEKLSGETDFFKNSELVVDLGLRPFQEEEFKNLCDIFNSTGVHVKGILSDNPITKLLAQEEGISLYGDRSILNSRVRVDHPVKAQRLKSRSEKSPMNRENALFVSKTIRAGQKIHFLGDITILGDVNPGSDVVSGGNILVFGALRGMAHAGAEGKKDAVVAALDLRPTQLRIADCIGRPPDKSAGARTIPEVARIVDGNIVVEPYHKQE